MADVKSNRRKVFINRIKQIYDLATAATQDSAKIYDFKNRFSALESTYNEFDRLHLDVISDRTITDSQLDQQELIRIEVDDQYFSIKGIYNELCVKSDMSMTVPASPSSFNQNTMPQFNLPRLDMPVFSGNLKQWPTFFDLYRSSVHNLTNVSDSQKFQILLTLVTGEPLSLLKNIPITDVNYTVAYDTLVNRYDNKRLLSTHYFNEIMNLPKISSPSNGALRNVVDKFCENVEALKLMNFPTAEWDFLLFNLLLIKIDSDTMQRFEMEHAKFDMPNFTQLKVFLNNRCKVLDTLTYNQDENKSKNVGPSSSNKQFTANRHIRTNSRNSQNPKAFFTNTSNTSFNNGPTSCCICKSLQHSIFNCSVFLSKTPHERYLLVKRNRLCVNCLGTHKFSKCCSAKACSSCLNRHHSLLHFDASQNNECSPSSDNILPSSNQPSGNPAHCGTTSVNTHFSKSAFTLLATAKVNFIDSQGHPHIVRVLLDSGSQGNFMSEQCFKKLGLSRSRLNIPINGLGDMSVVTSNGVTCCSVRPVGKVAPSFTMECIILPQICSSMPSTSFLHESWPHLEKLTLSDDSYNTPGPIDALIGCDLFPLILLPEKVCGEEHEPIAFNTLFGWVVMGKITPSKQINCSYSFCTLLEENRDINKTLQMFWEIEEVPNNKPLLPPDDPAEIYFNKTHSRNSEGRFGVSLPFTNGEPLFSDSRSIALRRFYGLERRLLKDPSLFKAYSIFMKEYLELGHMELVPAPVSDVLQRHFYIPHHGVTNLNSTTTKLRVVFDASCRPQGQSLNDTLSIGPKLQNEISSILLNFRRFPIAFTADIKMMYRQILVHDSHQDYQRILWRSSPREPVQDFRLKTVTYGVSSAPFLALRCLLQLAIEGRDKFPKAAKILESQIYIDDTCISCESVEEAVEIKNQLIDLLKEGGFFLRKWSSNSKEFLSTIPSDILQQPLALDSKSDPFLKVLGLRWSPKKDIFSYDIQILNSTCTKRSILSEISRIFDPIGLLCPITLLVKQLMQSLWARGIDWDSEVPDDIAQRWIDYKNDLSSLDTLEIPRWCFLSNYVILEFHAFGDASELGYGSCIYSRLVACNGQISTYLLYAKSKVSPLKRLSLPKLELSAALMASKLLKYVLNVYSIPGVHKMYAWTDSTIVLGWIKSSPHRWRTFVSNRVSQIQDNVAPDCWSHIKSEDNPADLASRPILPSQLVNCSLWWLGPSWLSCPSEEWPINEFSEPEEPLPEGRTTVLIMTRGYTPIIDILNKYSCLQKIMRILTYWRRFLSLYFKITLVVKTGPFTDYELFQTLLCVVKQVQAEVFHEEISNLKVKRPCSKPLRKLNPFIDKDGLLRVGGRLTYSQLDYEQKHTVLLPSKHRLTDLIIEDFHKRYLHCGQQALHYFISQRFWILGAKNAIRRVVHQCFRCFRVNPKPLEPKMGNLPSFRVTQARAFQCTSVDFGGPYQILMSRYRGCRTQKAYLSLFVCCATKCLHLELVSDLSTAAFLASLRRFISRRGRCSKLHSDNGTNYVGSARYLADCMAKAASEELIEWQFLPPSAPHFGGLHEAGIKSVKAHLSKIIGEQILTYEEFYTVLTQVEAVCNSRPLCMISSDPNDYSSLTPGHFLSLAPLSAVPDPDLTDIPINRLDRWQLLTQMHQTFWKRWHVEYLHSLQQRAKWHKDSNSITPGTLVVLKEDNLPPLQWRLGRIDSVHPGADGVTRVVTVRTKGGLIKRPVVKVCPLPAN